MGKCDAHYGMIGMAHVANGYPLYYDGYCEDTPVMYSLGNFLFNSKAQDTCLVKLTLDANGFKSLQFIPGRQQDCSVTMLQGTEKERVLSYMRKISPGVTIDGDGFVTKKG